MGAAVVLREVCKSYKMGDGSVLKAADGASFNIEAGSMTALVGASGSGKSTLLHLIGAIDVPDSGAIEIDGTDITKFSRSAAADYRSAIGFIFQQFHLVPSLSLLDNVCAPLVGRSLSSDKRNYARELLVSVGLEGREKSFPSQLSGGQQQRVAIARALVSQPKLLLADEPTGNLDSATAREILDVIAELHQQRQTTIIMATHDADIANRCDRVISVIDGIAVDRPRRALA
ncbi:MAG: ABC transporter ATP-binding protein [Propionibacteriaceae bacterium]